MKVILLERVESSASIGDVVNVKDGFARNFLLPQNKALRATNANLKVFESAAQEIEAHNAERREDAEPSAAKMADLQGHPDPPGRRRPASSTAR